MSHFLSEKNKGLLEISAQNSSLSISAFPSMPLSMGCDISVFNFVGNLA
jgi:hypothetical protein